MVNETKWCWGTFDAVNGWFFGGAAAPVAASGRFYAVSGPWSIGADHDLYFNGARYWSTSDFVAVSGDWTLRQRSGLVSLWNSGTQVGPDDGKWTQVTSNDTTACALKDDATLWCIGALGGSGLTQVGDAWSTARLSDERLCGIRQGELWCLTGSEPLARVGMDSGWTAIDAGGETFCALRQGHPYCFGRNASGVFGAPSPSGSNEPVAVGASGVFTAIAVGGQHACARGSSSTQCWGWRGYGSLGDGTPSDTAFVFAKATPFLADGETWASEASNYRRGCGVKPDGTLWHWGRIGGEIVASPAQLGTDTDWRSCATSEAFTQCALKTDGGLWCWDNDSDWLFPPNFPPSRDPFLVDVGPWVYLSSHGEALCGIRDDDSLWCWGGGATSPLGIVVSPVTDFSTPNEVGGRWREVHVGSGHACGITTDADAFCWGSNSEGQLGAGAAPTPSALPFAVTGPTGVWAHVALNDRGTCGTRLDGGAWCWGALGNSGSTATPTPVAGTGYTEIAMNYARTCALRVDGTLWCWSPSLSPPAQLGPDNDWLTLHSNDGGMCGLTTSHRRRCFGRSSEGQLGEGTAISPPVEVAFP